MEKVLSQPRPKKAKTPRINNRIEFRGEITKSGAKKKTKIATKPPQNAKEAQLIIAELYERNPLLSLTASISALTGLRYGDASWLTFDDFIDSQGRYRDYANICQQKTYRMRIGRGAEHSVAFQSSIVRIFVNKGIIAIIDECRFHSCSDTLLFANPRSSIKMPNGEVIARPMAVQSANYHHDLVKKTLSIDYALGTHSWRKYFAKKLVNKRVTVEKIRDLLGQTSLTSTNHYLTTFSEELAPLITNMDLFE